MTDGIKAVYRCGVQEIYADRLGDPISQAGSPFLTQIGVYRSVDAVGATIGRPSKNGTFFGFFEEK